MVKLSRIGRTFGEVELLEADNFGFRIPRAQTVILRVHRMEERRAAEEHGRTGSDDLGRARLEAAAVITFAPTPDGPRAVKIVYGVVPGGIDVSDLEAQLVANYGKPDLKDERGWVWGDTATFHSRKSAYLELRPHPVSAGARKPDATLILPDPLLQKHSRESITDAAAKGG